MVGKVVPLFRVQGQASEMSDEALVAACAVGDAAALGALFDRYCQPVRCFIGRMAAADDRDLDDLVQLTFEGAFSSAKRFAGRSAIRTWLFGIANNVVRRHARSEVRRKRAMARFAEDRRDCADGGADVLERERADRLARSIVSLPAKLREAFVLVYLENLSGRDAAQVLGVREGTIWKRLHQARVRLRDVLEEVRP